MKPSSVRTVGRRPTKHSSYKYMFLSNKNCPKKQTVYCHLELVKLPLRRGCVVCVLSQSNTNCVSLTCSSFTNTVCVCSYSIDLTSTVDFGPTLYFPHLLFHQVGGGTLVVEPGEGRDPLTVNDQVASNSF